MRSWKSHQLTSHTWLGLNPQIGRPLSRIVGVIGLFLFLKSKLLNYRDTGKNTIIAPMINLIVAAMTNKIPKKRQ
jgi:hypothetical protein